MFGDLAHNLLKYKRIKEIRMKLRAKSVNNKIGEIRGFWGILE